MIATRHQKNIPSRHYHASMERKPYPSETQERFIVRLPDGMRDRIADAAKTAGRSMNAEIVARLQDSFDGPKLGFGPGSTGERLKQAKAELDIASDLIVERVVQRLIERGASVSLDDAKSGENN